MTRRGRGRPPYPEILTPAEQRVLKELRRGGTNAEIAARLDVTLDAVKFHISNMLAKLELNSRVQLASWRPESHGRLFGRFAVPTGLDSLGTMLRWTGATLGGATLVAVVFIVFSTLGDGHQQVVSVPSAPADTAGPTVPSMASISVGRDHACGVRIDGSLICWGSNEDEDGEFVGKASPPAGSFVSVSAGLYHTCGIRTDGTAACWGSEESDGYFTGKATAPDGTFRAIAAGAEHTCWVSGAGSVACRGDGGAVQAPAGTFHRRHSRVDPQLRASNQWLDRVLGRQLLRATPRAHGVIHSPERRAETHVRAGHRRRRRVLGQRPCSPHAARGFVHLRDLGRLLLLRVTKRRLSDVLDSVREHWPR